MEQKINPVQKVSGDIELAPMQYWIDSGSTIKWHYTDPGSTLSRLRAVADKCISKWGPGISSRCGRKLAGDEGITCPKDLEWEF